jgi:glutamyl-tRNA synthetase
VEGRAPHWRFRLDHEQSIHWDDLIRGEQRFDPQLLSDPVIRRADGSWLYLLPSVIDDIDLGVTHIVRGEDHVSNSAVQLQMFDALGAQPPHLAHEALLVAAEGKLSKRLGAVGVGEMQSEGLEPMALLSLLARLGTSQPVEALPDLEPVAASFDFSHFGRAPAHFDMTEVEQLNARLLHGMPFEALAGRVPAWVDEEAWTVLRTALRRASEIDEWRDVIHGEIAAPELPAEERAFLAEAADVAGSLDWSADPWHALTDALKGATGRKGKTLFHPLRLALTGRERGPEMSPLVRLIGRDRSTARLKQSSSAQG